ncbi:MAG: hypothetical protein AAFV36_04725 [Myxococcota bacterium]
MSTHPSSPSPDSNSGLRHAWSALLKALKHEIRSRLPGGETAARVPVTERIRYFLRCCDTARRRLFARWAGVPTHEAHRRFAWPDPPGLRAVSQAPTVPSTSIDAESEVESVARLEAEPAPRVYRPQWNLGGTKVDAGIAEATSLVPPAIYRPLKAAMATGGHASLGGQELSHFLKMLGLPRRTLTQVQTQLRGAVQRRDVPKLQRVVTEAWVAAKRRRLGRDYERAVVEACIDASQGESAEAYIVRRLQERRWPDDLARQVATAIGEGVSLSTPDDEVPSEAGAPPS